jgi:DNA (cytosine-5)-methyltransferase 1
MNDSKLYIFSFFSGIGILDLGFERSGFRICYVNEYSKRYLEAYKYARNKLNFDLPEFGYYQGDVNDLLDDDIHIIGQYIKKIKERDPQAIIGFIGGPPCPDFSIAGKNKGRHGDNGRLSKSYIDLILENNPDFFLFENVKGLWKTKRHREFYDELKILLTLHGYELTDQLLNALEFGVPQDRDRIFLFGVQGDVQIRKSIKDFNWRKYSTYEMTEIKNHNWPTTTIFSLDSGLAQPEDTLVELTVEHWFRKNEVQSHRNSKQYFHPKKGLTKMLTINEGDTNKKSYKRVHRWRYSPTVAYGNNEVHLHPYFARRLSLSEALALQSLPKEFELPLDVTLTDGFKMIGNGVPYLLSKGIASAIRDFLMNT